MLKTEDKKNIMENNTDYFSFVSTVLTTLLNGKLLEYVRIRQRKLSLEQKIEQVFHHHHNTLAVELQSFFNLNGYIDLCRNDEHGIYLQFNYYMPSEEYVGEAKESEDIITKLYELPIITTVYKEFDKSLKKYIDTFNKAFNSNFKLENFQLVDQDENYFGYYDMRIHFDQKYTKEDIIIFQSFLDTLFPILFLNWKLPKLIQEIRFPKYYVERT